MTNLTRIFERKEKKYLLTFEDYYHLREALVPFMSEDEHGLHTISSLYCDTKDFELIRHSLEKPAYREKVRLRAYGQVTSEDLVFLEIKKKVASVVYKRRLSLTEGAARAYLSGGVLETHNWEENQISKEISYLKDGKALRPQVLIAYDRRALGTAELPTFRLTFDFNIRYRTSCLELSQGSHGDLVAPELDVLMEVKALGAYPLWFADILANLQIYPGSFTKYGQTYQRYLNSEELFHHVV